MNIKKYRHELVLQLRETRDARLRNELSNKIGFISAYINGEKAIKRYRDRAISAEIGKTHDKDAQLAILFNKEAEPEEYEAYQALRAECKARVDAKMAKLKAELEATLGIGS